MRTLVLACALAIAVAPRSARAEAPARPVLETIAGRTLEGRVVDVRPGRYAIVARPDGVREAVEWSRIRTLDGAPPPPVPAPTRGSWLPEGFAPQDVPKLAAEGKRASQLLGGVTAPKDGAELVGSMKGAQELLEKVGLKRGPPNAMMVAGGAIALPMCFFMNYGNLNGPHATYFGPGCRYFLVPVGAVMLVAAPFFGDKKEEMKGPSVHHLDVSVYALDYTKRSALTGALNRAPEGSLVGNNLGYDLGYTYIHPTWGLLAYGHTTLQQTTIATSDFVSVSNNFFKADAQIGLDAVRLLSGGKPDSYWTQHSAFFRAGPSYFHDWIVSRDVGSSSDVRYTLRNPLNQSIALVSAGGFELAAELDFRFPLGLGGVHASLERGTYPSIAFPELNARDSAFVALVGFDDLRAGDTYTWQRLKAELELPIDYSRFGGVFLGGQLARYENNFGSGVDNRGLSLDYRFRFQ